MSTHLRKARNHEDSRKAVCCVCGKMPKGSSTAKAITLVNDRQIEMVKSFVFQDYNVNNPMHPTGMCLGCNTALAAFRKVFFIV